MKSVPTFTTLPTHLVRTTVCPGCSGARLVPFYEGAESPVRITALHDTEEEARRAPRAGIRLGLCPDCGLVFNTEFDDRLTRYARDEDRAPHFSHRYRRYVEEVADELAARYEFAGGAVVQIGVGDGHFLSTLCNRSGSRGRAFDPAWAPGNARRTVRAQVEIVGTPRLDRGPKDAALLVCRRMLEKVACPLTFMRSVHQALDGADTAVFFEVRNGVRLLEEGDLREIAYERCSIFTPASLRALFLAAGFTVTQIDTRFDDQILTIEATPRPDPRASAPAGDRTDLTTSFAERSRARADSWRATIDRILTGGRTAVCWGAGLHGASLLNLLEVGTDRIARVVDINHRKQGRYVAGTGQRVVAPESLAGDPPDFVLLMNAAYEDEVRARLAELGVGAELVSLP